MRAINTINIYIQILLLCSLLSKNTFASSINTYWTFPDSEEHVSNLSIQKGSSIALFFKLKIPSNVRVYSYSSTFNYNPETVSVSVDFESGVLPIMDIKTISPGVIKITGANIFDYIEGPASFTLMRVTFYGNQNGSTNINISHFETDSNEIMPMSEMIQVVVIPKEITITLLSINTSTLFAGTSLMVKWETTNTRINDEIIISMKRSSVLETITTPDNFNWYRFTEHGADGKNDGEENISIPFNLKEAQDWRLFVRHIESNKWDSSEKLFDYNNGVSQLEQIISDKNIIISNLETTILSMLTKEECEDKVDRAVFEKNNIIATMKTKEEFNQAITAAVLKVEKEKNTIISSMITQDELNQAIAEAVSKVEAEKKAIISSMITQEELTQAVASAVSKLEAEKNEIISSMITQEELTQAVASAVSKLEAEKN